MKRIIFISLLSICTSAAMSQLKVTPDGKVGIGITQTPVSKFAVGSVGDPSFSSSFESNTMTMAISSSGINTNWGNWANSLFVNMQATGSRIYNGITVYTSKTASSSNGRTIGIYAEAGNATSGYNAAVLGTLIGNNNGAAILGTFNGESFPVNGRYAGYFMGDVKVTGTLNSVVVGNSDIRYKDNVEEIGSAGKSSVLKNVLSLNPISYNYKQIYIEEVNTKDSLKSASKTDPKGFYDEKSQMFQKKHFGVVAQDLQKIYPDLVYENDNGYLSVNYVEMIPLLIQSIKELKKEIDILSSSSALSEASVRRSAISNEAISGNTRAELHQNAPNLFTNRTEIKFSIPDNSVNALLFVFDMQGSMLKQIPLSRSQSSVIINGSELNAGMYLYSLVIDGTEIDTKRMILTK